MRPWFAQKMNTLFNMLFVMMEGLDAEFRTSTWRKTCLLFAIDFLQLLRVLTSPLLGWSGTVSQLIEKFDIVYDFTLLGSMVVPRFSFFILASVTVTFALLETVFVARIFEMGSVKKMWPVKLLRFIVVAMVTTLFSSFVKWLLIPFTCIVSDVDSFSEEIHGPGTECDPFRFPEVLASAPTLVVVVLYIAFAFTATTFSLSVNVLSRAPRSQSTGRVEFQFLLTKVLATSLTFLTHVISPTAIAAILFVCAAATMRAHANTLPFHHHGTNLLRGGIYGATTWAALSTIVVSVTDGMSLEWTLIGLLPVAFLLGVYLVHCSRESIFGALDRLRGEFEQKMQVKTLQRHHRHHHHHHHHHPDHHQNHSDHHRHHAGGQAPSKGLGSPLPRHGAPVEVQIGSEARKRFYDSVGEKRRVFHSGQHALTCARVLLYQRDPEDQPFLEFVIERGLADYRDFVPLRVFKLLVLYLVLGRAQEGNVLKKALSENKDLPSDLAYLLYCIERKSEQETAAVNLIGKKGPVSAINLMEFNVGLSKAKSAHKLAIASLKNFWKVASMRVSVAHGNQGLVETQLEDMMRHLEQCQERVMEAEREYGTLIYKYPTSVEILYSYSSFLDVCCNDSVGSETRRAEAKAIQEEGHEEESKLSPMPGGRGDGHHLGDDDGRGSQDGEDAKRKGEGTVTSGSSHETKRVKLWKQVQSWQTQVMGGEQRRLVQLNRSIQVMVVVVVLMATVAFVISDFVLFKGMAKVEMHKISNIGHLRTSCVSVAWYLRNMVTHAQLGEHQKVAEYKAAGLHEVEEVRTRHVFVHEEVDFREADLAFNSLPLTTAHPTALGWELRERNLWEAGNDFHQRGEVALEAGETELANHSFGLDSMSYAKQSVPYVMENAWRVMVPAYDNLTEVYVHQIEVIEQTEKLLVTINAVGNSTLLAAIAFLFMRGMIQLVHYMEAKMTMIQLAYDVRKSTCRKLSHFYRRCEKHLQAVEDEDLSRTMVMEEEDKGDDDEEEEEEVVYRMEIKPKETLIDRTGSDGSAWPGTEAQSESDSSTNTGTAQKPDGSLQVPLRNSVGAARQSTSDLSPCQREDSERLYEAKGQVDESASTGESVLETPTILPLTAANLQRFDPSSGDGSFRKSQGTDQSDSKRLARRGVLLRTASRDQDEEEEEQEEMTYQPAAGLSEAVLVAAGRAEAAHLEGRMAAAKTSPSLLQQQLADVAERQEAKDEEDNGAGVGDLRRGGSKGSGSRGSKNDGGSKGSAAGGAEQRRDSDRLRQGRADAEEAAPQAVRCDVDLSRRSPNTDEPSTRDEGAVQGAVAEEQKPPPPPAPRSPALRMLNPRTGGVELSAPTPPADVPVQRVGSAGSRATGTEKEVSVLELRTGKNNGVSFPSGAALEHAKDMSREATDEEEDEDEESIEEAGLRPSSIFRKQGSPMQSIMGFSRKQSSEHLSEADAELEESARTAKKRVQRALAHRRVWYMRSSVHLLMFGFLCALCVLSSLLPSQQFPALVSLAPIVAEAGRRITLLRSTAFLAQELVLADGLGRLDQQELSDSLALTLRELRATDQAIRLGGDKHIGEGADNRNDAHNQIMYHGHCPWREAAAHRRAGGGGGEAGGGEECADPVNAAVGSSGLLSVLNAFWDAGESVLLRYGLPADETRGDAYLKPRAEADGQWEAFSRVEATPAALHAWSTDKDLHFLYQSATGNLYEGLEHVLQLLDHELDVILEDAVYLNDVLFSCYLVTIILFFYWLVFRRAVKHALYEAHQAHTLVGRIPLHILKAGEVERVANHFKRQQDGNVIDYDAMEEDMDGTVKSRSSRYPDGAESPR